MTHPAPTHLQSKTAALLALSNDERVRVIRQGNFVELPRFKDIFQQLNVLLDFDQVTRPPGLLIVAPANNGKSSILERFLAQANAARDPDTEVDEIRVVMIQTPAAGDRLGFYQRILDAMFTVYNPRSPWTTLRSQVVRTMQAHGVKVLLLDELHDALAGTPNQQNLFNIELKQLMTETKVCMAAAGLPKAPLLFIRDPQLTSRFKAVDLDPFKADAELGQFLASLERRIPLKHPSNLKDPRIVAEVARRSSGGIGDIYSLIAHCAIKAIRDGTTPERITLTSIRESDWQRPTQRAAFTRQGRDAAAAEARASDEAFAREIDAAYDRTYDEPEGQPAGADADSATDVKERQRGEVAKATSEPPPKTTGSKARAGSTVSQSSKTTPTNSRLAKGSKAKSATAG